METRSEKRNRVYKWKFDHDEARKLRAEGLTYTEIGKRLGVTHAAVRRVCDDSVREAMYRDSLAWQRSGTCVECGEPCAPVSHPTNRSGIERCRSCANFSRRRCWFETDDGQLIVRCTSCKEWLSEDRFPPSLRRRYDHGITSDGGRRQCSMCASAARRLYRHTHPEQRERENKVLRDKRRQQRAAAKEQP